MAYVGTVSLHDSDGKSLLTKRFAATANEGPDELVERIAKEVLHQKARYGDAPISVIQDGAPELRNLVGEMCTKHHVTPRFEPEARSPTLRSACSVRTSSTSGTTERGSVTRPRASVDSLLEAGRPKAHASR